MRDRMAVVDVKEQKLVTTFETGVRPHPGRGANWQDPEYGWVNATVDGNTCSEDQSEFQIVYRSSADAFPAGRKFQQRGFDVAQMVDTPAAAQAQRRFIAGSFRFE